MPSEYNLDSIGLVRVDAAAQCSAASAFSQRAASSAASGESPLAARSAAIRRRPLGHLLRRKYVIFRSRPPSFAADRAATEGNALKVELFSTLRALSSVDAL